MRVTTPAFSESRSIPIDRIDTVGAPDQVFDFVFLQPADEPVGDACRRNLVILRVEFLHAVFAHSGDAPAENFDDFRRRARFACAENGNFFPVRTFGQGL